MKSTYLENFTITNVRPIPNNHKRNIARSKNLIGNSIKKSKKDILSTTSLF
jgi:hypothetical protein